MKNFTYLTPTKICFGEGQISHLKELKKSGTKVLLVYGGGSIRRMGLYDEAAGILKDEGLTVFELSGVEPNPRIESVRAGAALCKENGIEMVLAIGGGSVLDCAKVIAGAACYDGDAWDLVIHPRRIKASLPIYTVLTMSATGSEMNGNAVITDMNKNEKWGTYSPLFKPVLSILDPTYTYSVPAKQTAAGTADIMSHTFENYFTPERGIDLQAGFAETILKTCIKYGPAALKNPNDYEARANLMWASTNAINGLLSCGAAVSWCVHPMQHELSAFYDVTHGEGLALLTPHWMEYALAFYPEETTAKFADYGVNVWGIPWIGDPAEIAKEAIRRTRDFFVNDLHIPGTMRELGIPDKRNFAIMAKKAADGCKGSYVPLDADAILHIYDAAF